jgi:hypothetical protein
MKKINHRVHGEARRKKLRKDEHGVVGWRSLLFYLGGGTEAGFFVGVKECWVLNEGVRGYGAA